MARSGGFGGFGLDPFGGGGGDLSRYNLGSTVQALDELEAYQIAVGWANGTVSDEEYLESLRAAIERTAEGSRDRVTAQDKYDDAVYRIERNKLVGVVNDADDDNDRIAALRALINHDRARSGQMVENNEQRREIDATIRGLEADIRQTRYGAMVERVNRGRASTSDLLELARSLYAEADSAGGPDERDWSRIIGELRDRLADERLVARMQDYQHERISGPTMLADLDARLAELTPGSPAYNEILRQREDLNRRLRDEEMGRIAAQAYSDFQQGKITDNAYIAALVRAAEKETPGTQARIDAEARVRQATFSLAEDKLRYDVQMDKPGSVSKLLAFYRSYQSTMLVGSSEWRQIDLAIASLQRRGGSGGGGGGSSSGGRIAPPKIIPTGTALNDLIAGAGPFAGMRVPANLGRLLQIRPDDPAEAKWFDNNRRSMVQAYQNGDDEWTFFDMDGKGYDLPFTASMLAALDEQNVRYMQELVVHADTPKERQTAVGKLITALTQHRDRGGQIAMDRYTSVMQDLDREKEQALALGRFDDYVTLAMGQEQLIRGMLMLPDNVPVTDVNMNMNPLLDDAMVNRLATDLDRIEPAVFDPAMQGYHPRGDQVLAAIAEGAIIVRDLDRDGVYDDFTVDEDRGFVTQGPNGEARFTLLNPLDRSAYYTAEDGTQQPLYKSTHHKVTIWNADGERETFWQPIQPGGVTLPIRVMGQATALPGAPGTASAPGLNAGTAAYLDRPLGLPVPTGQQVPQPIGIKANEKGWYSFLTGTGVSQGVLAFTVQERNRQGKLVPYQWVSLDGSTWLRMNAEAGSVTPQLVLNPGSGATWNAETGQLMVNGEGWDPARHGPIANFAHFYGTTWRDANGKLQMPDWMGKGSGSAGIGAPGQFFEVRSTNAEGLDVTSYENTPGYDEEIRRPRPGDRADIARAAAERRSLNARLNPAPPAPGSEYDDFGRTTRARMGRSPLVQPSATLGDVFEVRMAQRAQGDAVRAARASALIGALDPAIAGKAIRSGLRNPAAAQLNPAYPQLRPTPQRPNSWDILGATARRVLTPPAKQTTLKGLDLPALKPVPKIAMPALAPVRAGAKNTRLSPIPTGTTAGGTGGTKTTKQIT